MKSPIATIDIIVCPKHVQSALQYKLKYLQHTDYIMRVTLEYEYCWHCKYEMRQDYRTKYETMESPFK
jgi:hypothetical protein